MIEAGTIRWHLHLGRWSLWSDKGEAQFDDLLHVSIRDDWHLSRKQAARIQKTKKDSSPTMEFLVDLFFPRGSLILTKKDGGRREIEGLMFRFEKSDLEEMVTYIHQHQSHLICDDSVRELQ
ncbi:MAG TPA: hypothetical protein PKN33_16385 [Phycisphaerae bacterium]|nr:hypothetical protein [Phycisphaerae bacterium]